MRGRNKKRRVNEGGREQVLMLCLVTLQGQVFLAQLSLLPRFCQCLTWVSFGFWLLVSREDQDSTTGLRRYGQKLISSFINLWQRHVQHVGCARKSSGCEGSTSMSGCNYLNAACISSH